MIHFVLNGQQYRTDGKIVEGKDGDKWNRTGSLAVVLAAREAYKGEYTIKGSGQVQVA